MPPKPRTRRPRSSTRSNHTKATSGNENSNTEIKQQGGVCDKEVLECIDMDEHEDGGTGAARGGGGGGEGEDEDEGNDIEVDSKTPHDPMASGLESGPRVSELDPLPLPNPPIPPPCTPLSSTAPPREDIAEAPPPHQQQVTFSRAVDGMIGGKLIDALKDVWVGFEEHISSLERVILGPVSEDLDREYAALDAREAILDQELFSVQAQAERFVDEPATLGEN